MHWHRSVMPIYRVYQDGVSEKTTFVGTGFIIHHDDRTSYLLTCTHVVREINENDRFCVGAVDGPGALVVARGHETNYDMAVLAVKDALTDRPTLPLQEHVAANSTLVARVASPIDRQIVMRDIQFRLNDRRQLNIPGLKGSVRSHQLEPLGGEVIDKGNSGSPVLHSTTNDVIGVLTIRQSNGPGLAVSVAALPMFWSDCPTGLVRNARPGPPIPAPPEQYSRPPYTLTKRFIGRAAELERLDAWAHSPDPLLVVEAIGGVGKSALGWEWLRSRACQAFRPAGVIWWSFYESGAMIETFVRHALAYITGQDPEALKETPYHERSEQLLFALERRPYLLALDGLERILVAYNRIDRAQMRDDQLSNEQHLRDCADPRDNAFLRQLLALQKSKVLIISRLMPRELAGQTGVRTITLDGLQPADARELMYVHGVKHASDALLMPFLKHIGYHGLLIQIVAGLVEKYRAGPGNFDQWYRSRGQSMRVSETIDQYRSDILKYAFAELSDVLRRLLCHLAVFSAPVNYQTIAIFNPYRPPEPPLPALPALPQLVPSPFGSPRTAALERQRHHASGKARPKLEDALEMQRWEDTLRATRMQENRTRLQHQWHRIRQERIAILAEHRRAYQDSEAYRSGEGQFDRALSELEDRGLLQWDRENDTYDLHPVVRGYAYELLQQDEREQALGRLRDHFAAVPQLDQSRVCEPGDIIETLSACQALVLAGKHDLAASYFNAVLAGVLHRLGAYPQIIELLSPMFVKGFDHPPALEQPEDQNLIINHLGRALQMVGQHEQAFQLIQLECNPALIEKRWDAYVGVTRYSHHLLDMNRILDALHGMRFAGQLVPLSNRAWQLLHLSDIYLQIGDTEQAQEYHREASSIHEPHLHPEGWRLSMARRALELKRTLGTVTQAEYAQALQQIDAARGEKIHLHRLHCSWALFCLERGDLPGAAAQSAVALQLAQQLGIRAIAPMYMLQARVALAQSNRRQAARLQSDALAGLAWLTPADQARVLAESAALSLGLGDRVSAGRDALLAYRMAWADGPPNVVAEPLAVAGRVLEQLEVTPPELPVRTQPDPVPFEQELRELLAAGGRLAEDAKQAPEQASFETSFFRWLQIGTVATFGVNNQELIASVARKLSSLSTLSGPIVLSRMGQVVPEPDELEVAVEQRRFDEIEWSFEELQIFDKVFAIIFLLSADAQGRDVFAYVNVRVDRIKKLLDQGEQGEPFDLAQNATVVLTGQGMPTIEQRERLQHEYLFGEHHVNVRIFPPLKEVS